MEEIDAEEENRLWEEAEAKRRAEFAKKIKEEAAASAKIRAEEDRLWEEAWAKRKAEVEKARREEAETSANRSAKDKKRLKKETEAKKRAEEERRNKEAAELAKRKVAEQNRLKKVEEAKRNAEEERRKEEAEAKKRAEEKRKLTEDLETAHSTQPANQQKFANEANRKGENKNRLKEEAEANYKAEVANRSRPDIEANTKTEGTQAQQNPNLKKRVLLGSILALFVIICIWAFSLFTNGPEEESPPLKNIEETVVEDPIILEKTNIDSLNRVTTLSNLGVGDIFEGGFIFAIDPSGNTGKIAHIDDAGPMPWQNAIKIHEQLGEGWRLPTFDELQIMYRNIGQGATNIGEFSDGLYWSSTAYDEYQARLLRFRDANTSYHYNKNVENRKFRVRAIRDFKR